MGSKRYKRTNERMNGQGVYRSRIKEFSWVRLGYSPPLSETFLYFLQEPFSTCLRTAKILHPDHIYNWCVAWLQCTFPFDSLEQQHSPLRLRGGTTWTCPCHFQTIPFLNQKMSSADSIAVPLLVQSPTLTWPWSSNEPPTNSLPSSSGWLSGAVDVSISIILIKVVEIEEADHSILLQFQIAMGDNPFITWMNIFLEWIIVDFLE